MVLWLHRNIGSVVFCGVAVLVHIHAEYREVASMAWPHPIVGVAAKLADSIGRSTYKAHILIIEIDAEKIRIALKKRLYLNPVKFRRILLLIFSGDFLDVGVNLFLAVIVDTFQYIVGNVGNLLQDAHVEVGRGYFLIKRHSPESVLEVVVRHSTVLLYALVAAMVIGENQSLIRYNLTGTIAAKHHYGILEARFIDAIHVLRLQAEALRLHLLVILANEVEQPHSLVGSRRGCRNSN